MLISGEGGGVRLGLLFLLVGFAGCWGGGQHLYTASRYREPLRLTMDEYLRTKPTAPWLEVKDAVVYLPGAAHLYNKFSSSDRAPATEIYIPLYAARPSHDDEPSRVLLATKNPDLLAIYNGIGRQTSELQIEEFVEKHSDQLSATRTVRGLVRFGIDLDDDEQKELRKVANLQNDDFIILDEGKQPSSGEGAFGLAFGVAAALLGLWQVLKSAGSDPAPST
jgi:hypothetical protein